MRYLEQDDIPNPVATTNPSGDTKTWQTQLTAIDPGIRRGYYADLAVVSLSAIPLDVNVVVNEVTFFLYLNSAPVATFDLSAFNTSAFTFSYSGVLNLPQPLRLFPSDRLQWGMRVVTNAAPAHVNIDGGDLFLIGELSEDK